MGNAFQSPFKSAHTGSKSIFRCPCGLESLLGKHGELVVGGTETNASCSIQSNMLARTKRNKKEVRVPAKGSDKG